MPVQGMYTVFPMCLILCLYGKAMNRLQVQMVTRSPWAGIDPTATEVQASEPFTSTRGPYGRRTKEFACHLDGYQISADSGMTEIGLCKCICGIS